MSYCTKFSWIPAWSVLLLYCVSNGLFPFLYIYIRLVCSVLFNIRFNLVFLCVGVRVEQAAAEDWQGGGGEGQVRPAEVHAPGTAQGKAGTAPGTAQGKAWC